MDINIIHSVFFYIIAGVLILSAIGVIFLPKIIYSAISLITSFLSIAGIFILLNADFLGLSQVMIYAVGVTIVILFAIMLTGEKHEKKLWIAFSPRTLFAMGFAFLFFIIMSTSVTNNFSKFSEDTGLFAIEKQSESTIEKIKTEGTTSLIGEGIFTKYVLPFEILSLLLLAVVLGAVVLAKKPKGKAENSTL